MLIAALFWLTGSWSLAQASPQPEPEQILASYLPSKNSSSLMDPGTYFNVKVSPQKNRYRTLEPISLKVVGSHAQSLAGSYFLYLFTVNQATGEAALLFPNHVNQQHEFRLGTSATLPQAGVEIYADQPGIERIYVLATRERQPWETFKQVQIEGLDDTSMRGLRLRSLLTRQAFHLTDQFSLLIVD